MKKLLLFPLLFASFLQASEKVRFLNLISDQEQKIMHVKMTGRGKDSWGRTFPLPEDTIKILEDATQQLTD